MYLMIFNICDTLNKDRYIPVPLVIVKGFLNCRKFG